MLGPRLSQPSAVLLGAIHCLRLTSGAGRHGHQLHLGPDASLYCCLLLTLLPSVVEVSLALLSYVGILIIVTDGNLAGFEFENITGVMLAIGSTVLWGLSWVINTRTVERDQVDPELALLVEFLDGCARTLDYLERNGQPAALKRAPSLGYLRRPI